MADHIDSSGLQLVEFKTVSTFPYEGEECSIRLQLKPGYSMLYGKNGSGKTRLISSIKRLCAGKSSPENQLASHAIFKIDCEQSSGHRLTWLTDSVKALLDDASGGEAEIVEELLAIKDALASNSGSDYLNEVELPTSWVQNERTTDSDALLLQDLRVFLLVPFLVDLYFLGLLRDLSDAEMGLYGEFIEEVVRDGYVGFFVDENSSSPSWKVQLFARCDEVGKIQQKVFYQSVREIGEWSASLIEPIATCGAWEDEFLTYPFFQEVTGSELDESPYVRIDTFLSYKCNRFPLAVLDLNDLPFAEEFINRELVPSVESLPTFMSLVEEAMPDGGELFIGSSGEAQIVTGGSAGWDWRSSESAEFMVDILNVIDSANVFIRDSGVYLSDAYLAPYLSTDAVLGGRLFSLQFCDSREIDPVWSVTYAGLSDAQRRIVDIFIGIENFRRDYQQFLVIGDEIDSNMHPSAVVNLHRTLFNAAENVLISTHSFEALASPIGHRYHISRLDGRITLGSFEGHDVEDLAHELGTSPSAVLGLVRLFVLVEGEHDRVVVEHLLRDLVLGGSFWTAECLVIPIRGINGAWRTIDARILDYSDAQILIVTDNADSARLNLLKDQLMSAEFGLNRDRDVRKIRHIFNPQTHEENLLFDLFGSRRSVSELKRISAFGLMKKDIIEYFDPQVFGLSGQWVDYRSEFETVEQPGRKVRDFKGFLRNQYQASISVDVIKAAIESLDSSFPKEFGDLISTINELLEFNRLQTLLGKE